MKYKNSHKWDAKLYDKSSQFQFNLGLKAIEMLKPKDGEKILDIGCGNAMTTIEIAKLIPHGNITGIELSEHMIEQAKKNLQKNNILNVNIIHDNALDINFRNQFHAVFSNSALHWIINLERMYTLLYNALKTGGRLMVQTGLKEINALFKTIQTLENDKKYHTYFQSMDFPWRFLTSFETEEILEKCGFCAIQIEPIQMIIEFDNKEDLCNYIRAAALVPYLNVLPQNLHDEFINDSIVFFLESNGENNLTMKHTRLYIQAKKP
ncbi:MAG: methyltransferase domain-containing protein [Candidatus Lokiarchaeota archaeon]|nr:methyltransferase domain-containing protein [Candidatus Lokiarchaeota archaeon]